MVTSKSTQAVYSTGSTPESRSCVLVLQRPPSSLSADPCQFRCGGAWENIDPVAVRLYLPNL